MNPLKQLTAVATFCFAAVVVAATAPAREDLVALASKAQVEGQIAGWCRGVFEPGHSGAYAVAAPSPKGGGRYVVLGMSADAIELAAYAGGADLACYTPAEAKELNDAIVSADTVQGGIAPIWSTTVVCGFLEQTSAACWQYSPSARAFVMVGEWIT